MKGLFRALLTAWLLVGVWRTAGAASGEICLEGDYAGHLQYVWMAGDTIWWAHTDWLLKAGWNEAVMKRITGWVNFDCHQFTIKPHVDGVMLLVR